MGERRAIVLSRRMALTRAEFLRTLPALIGHLPHRLAGNAVAVRDGDRRLRIRFEASGERCLGALRLPELSLSLSFSGYPPAEVARFMARFDRLFHRGGG